MRGACSLEVLEIDALGRHREAAKRQNCEAAKLRSGKTAKRQNCEAAKHPHDVNEPSV
ncbi:MAG: hypothetical protein GY822_14160 [Deltaproteobacteria bacterium]|nr:hypothetical protein [Deltaproteobacteria bacterium]